MDYAIGIVEPQEYCVDLQEIHKEVHDKAVTSDFQEVILTDDHNQYPEGPSRVIEHHGAEDYILDKGVENIFLSGKPTDVGSLIHVNERLENYRFLDSIVFDQKVVESYPSVRKQAETLGLTELEMTTIDEFLEYQ